MAGCHWQPTSSHRGQAFPQTQNTSPGPWSVVPPICSHLAHPGPHPALAPPRLPLLPPSPHLDSPSSHPHLTSTPPPPTLTSTLPHPSLTSTPPPEEGLLPPPIPKKEIRGMQGVADLPSFNPLVRLRASVTCFFFYLNASPTPRPDSPPAPPGLRASFREAKSGWVW